MKTPKHYFASANTNRGFFSLFDNINDPSKKSFTFVLKGGPGTGKSTLMKNVANHFLNKDIEVEFFNCSSDIDSLDGIRLSDFNISIVDGTAPHVIEAKDPGIHDKIVNLGEFIGSGVAQHSEKISELNQKTKTLYSIAYDFIFAASSLFEARCKSLPQNEVLVNDFVKDLIVDLPIVSSNLGKERKLFLSAIGGNGKINFAESNNYAKTTILPFEGYFTSLALTLVAEEMQKKGYDIISFFDPLNTSLREAISIPKLDWLLIKKPLEGEEKSNLIEIDASEIDNLLSFAASAIAKSKVAHREIESYYIPNMDFAKISALTHSLILEIENMISEK